MFREIDLQDELLELEPDGLMSADLEKQNRNIIRLALSPLRTRSSKTTIDPSLTKLLPSKIMDCCGRICLYLLYQAAVLCRMPSHTLHSASLTILRVEFKVGAGCSEKYDFTGRSGYACTGLGRPNERCLSPWIWTKPASWHA